MNAACKRALPALLLTVLLGLSGALGASAQTVTSCVSFGFGTSGSSTQVNCGINAGASLSAPNTLYVVATAPVGTTTARCAARPSSGLTVQGNAATVPVTAATTAIPGVGFTGCELQVQTGTEAAGSGLGDIGLTLPSAVTAGSTIQLSALVCTDPTCTTLISSQQLSATVSPTGNCGGGQCYGGRGSNHDRDDNNGNGGYCQYSGSGAYTGGSCQPNQQYCNGVYIPAGQYCSQNGSQYCNGIYIPAGQYCSQNVVQYCNGVVIPPGAPCNQYCPTGQIALIGQTCLNGGSSVTYPAGWNIVAGPTGTVIPNVASSLYTLPPGATGYVTLPGSTPLIAGTGYWAYFNTSTTVSLPSSSSGAATIQLTPNQYTLIGNPGNATATVSGTSLSVLTYSPTSASYTATTQLQPGQGAWVASPVGGPVTITSGYSPLTPPPPPPPL